MTYNSLQAGRAIAAFFVLWHHLSGAFASEKYFRTNLFSVPLDLGMLGVLYFFVLSGFLITHIHSVDVNQPTEFVPYLKKRAIRIYPIYWLVFALALTGILMLPERSELPTSFTFVKALLLVPMDKAAVGGTGAPIVIVAWTLQYEVFFYFLFGMAILSRYLMSACVVFLLGCSVANLFIPLPFPLAFMASSHVASFAIGVIVALAFNRLAMRKNAAWMLLGVTLPFFLLGGHYEMHHETQLLILSVLAAFILFSLLQLERAGQSLSGGKCLQLCGDASYSLYLLHYPLISLLCKMAVMCGLSDKGPLVDIASFIALFSICVIASIVLHVYFEKPSIRILRSWLLKSPKPHAVNAEYSAG